MTSITLRKIYMERRDNNLALKENLFHVPETLMQTAYFSEFTVIDGRYIPVKQIFIDEFERK